MQKDRRACAKEVRQVIAGKRAVWSSVTWTKETRRARGWVFQGRESSRWPRTRCCRPTHGVDVPWGGREVSRLEGLLSVRESHRGVEGGWTAWGRTTPQWLSWG